MAPPQRVAARTRRRNGRGTYVGRLDGAGPSEPRRWDRRLSLPADSSAIPTRDESEAPRTLRFGTTFLTPPEPGSSERPREPSPGLVTTDGTSPGTASDPGPSRLPMIRWRGGSPVRGGVAVCPSSPPRGKLAVPRRPMALSPKPGGRPWTRRRPTAYRRTPNRLFRP